MQKIIIFVLYLLMLSYRIFTTKILKIHYSQLNMLSSTSNVRFYQEIGSPKFICAPMVDQSELAWRLLVKRHGCDLAFTQMILSKCFLSSKSYQYACSDWKDYTILSNSSITQSQLSQKFRITEKEASTLDKNLIVQLAGNNPEVVIKAGRLVQSRASAIDLNLGCPQNTARKGNYGSHLLQDSTLTLHILSKMVENLDCPITAKIRVYDNDDRTVQLCRDFEKIGVSMITVHGRTVEANKLFVGTCDWNVIRKIKEAVNIPVIANGGIGNYDDINRCFEFTRADGVMSSEALLENPRLFTPEGDNYFRTDYVNSQISIVDEYLYLVEAFQAYPARQENVRSHMFKMLYRFMDAPINADLRKRLSEEGLSGMHQVFTELKERLSRIDFNTDVALERGFLGPTNWYMRHRDKRAIQKVLSTPKGAERLKKRGYDFSTPSPRATICSMGTRLNFECPESFSGIDSNMSKSSIPELNSNITPTGKDCLVQQKILALKARYGDKLRAKQTLSS